MIKDPRQIITPFAFAVHPSLLGLPLATPKRHLAAFLIDLVIASVLTGLGNVFLALGVTIIFFWIAIRTRGKNIFHNMLRYIMATSLSIFVFAIALGIIEGMDPNDNDTTKLDEAIIANSENIDWLSFGQQMAAIDYTNEEAMEDGIMEVVTDLGLVDTSNSEYTSFLEEMPTDLSNQLQVLIAAIQRSDTVHTDSLRAALALILAKPELAELEHETDRLVEWNDNLKEENEELTDQIDHPSFYKTIKNWFSFMGLSLGWIGIYFITTIAFFRGQTLGKRFLKIRVIRLNNKPIGLFFAFERFGGYAAGLATGLLGFFQIFWDANRQAIHDKIAGTVVIDLRDSKIRKTESYRNEILEQENLLS